MKNETMIIPLTICHNLIVKNVSFNFQSDSWEAAYTIEDSYLKTKQNSFLSFDRVAGWELKTPNEITDKLVEFLKKKHEVK